MLSNLILEAEKELEEVEEMINEITDEQLDEWLRILDECLEDLEKYWRMIA